MSDRLPPLGIPPEIVEQRIHEVAALNRLCHSLSEFGKSLSLVPAANPAKAPEGASASSMTAHARRMASVWRHTV
jgi:hypothetical protein